MAKPTHIPTPDSRKGSADDPTHDYALWQKLRPYIGHCLTLNHEINNAMTGLLGYIDFMLLERLSLTADQIEQLETIQAAALKIKSAADRLSREKIELAEDTDLRPVIEAYTRLDEGSE